ncbi:MAG: hypothetical protein AB7E29_08825 [Xanthobacter sp.]
MYCCECKRCGHRTLLEDEAVKPPVSESGADAAGKAGKASSTPEAGDMRCTMCGSRKVRLIHFDSRFEALSYTLKRP